TIPTPLTLIKASRTDKIKTKYLNPVIHAAVPDTTASTPGTSSADIGLPNAHRHSLSMKLLPQKAWRTQNHQNVKNRLMQQRKHHRQHERPNWFQTACKFPLTDITRFANINSSESQPPKDLDDNSE